MPKFSTRSLSNLSECHPDLRAVLEQAIEVVDFVVYEGHRSMSEQQRMFDEGKSKARPGESKHNLIPSEAADLWAYPINFADTEQQHFVAGVVVGIAHMMGVPIRWGNDWDRDGDTRDNRFDDLPHFELM